MVTWGAKFGIFGNFYIFVWLRTNFGTSKIYSSRSGPKGRSRSLIFDSESRVDWSSWAAHKNAKNDENSNFQFETIT